MSKRKPNWTDREKMILMEEYVKKKGRFKSKIFVCKKENERNSKEME